MRAVRKLEPPRAGDALVSFSVSPAGEAVCAWASPPDHARLHARSAKGSPQTLLAPPGATLRVTIEDVSGGVIAAGRDGGPRPERGRPAPGEVRELGGVLPANPSVHALPDGELLVVGARAARRGGDPQHNAVVFGSDGRIARSACLGDGINRVVTTASGQIWVGYFDEGVFGNFGWGDGGASTPIGAPGWNRFANDLQLAWSHPDPEEGEIVDCYAMTTSGERCYVCPYTDWPILSADETGAFRRVKNEVGGASELLVGPHVTALVGGYQDQRARVVAGMALEGRLRLAPAAGRLSIAGEPWSGGGLMATRDGVLYAIAEGTCYALSSEEIGEALDVYAVLATAEWGKQPRRPRGR